MLEHYIDFALQCEIVDRHMSIYKYNIREVCEAFVVRSLYLNLKK